MELDELFADTDEVSVVGQVATLVITVAGSHGYARDYRQLEDQARGVMSEASSELVGRFAEPIRDRLGAGFEVESVQVRPGGSFTVFVAIAAAVPVVIFYGSLRSGLRFLAEDIRWVIDRFVSRFETDEAGLAAKEPEVVPGPGLYAAKRRTTQLPPAAARPDMIVLYMMAMNALLVIGLLALAAVLLAKAI